MAGKAVGVARVMRGVVDRRGIRETGTEDEQSAEEKGNQTCGETIAERKRCGRNSRRSHDNLRAGNREAFPWDGRNALAGWQVSWLAGEGARGAPAGMPRLPGGDAAQKGAGIEAS